MTWKYFEMQHQFFLSISFYCNMYVFRYWVYFDESLKLICCQGFDIFVECMNNLLIPSIFSGLTYTAWWQPVSRKASLKWFNKPKLFARYSCRKQSTNRRRSLEKDFWCHGMDWQIQIYKIIFRIQSVAVSLITIMACRIGRIMSYGGVHENRGKCGRRLLRAL